MAGLVTRQSSHGFTAEGGFTRRPERVTCNRCRGAPAAAVRRVVARHGELDPARPLSPPPATEHQRRLDEGVARVDWSQPPATIADARAAYTPLVTERARHGGRVVRWWVLGAGLLASALWVGGSILLARLTDDVLALWRDWQREVHWLVAVVAAPPGTAEPHTAAPWQASRAGDLLIVGRQVTDAERGAAMLDAVAAEARRLAVPADPRPTRPQP